MVDFDSDDDCPGVLCSLLADSTNNCVSGFAPLAPVSPLPLIMLPIGVLLDTTKPGAVLELELIALRYTTEVQLEFR
jgi:hypothetical protein